MGAVTSVTQVGQVVTVGMVVAATTVLAVTGKIDATTAVAVILGVTGIGSGASVAVHAQALPPANSAPSVAPQEAPRGDQHVG